MENISKHFAIDFFHKSSSSTSKQYTDHILSIYREFDIVKIENLKKITGMDQEDMAMEDIDLLKV